MIDDNLSYDMSKYVYLDLKFPNSDWLKVNESIKWKYKEKDRYEVN